MSKSRWLLGLGMILALATTTNAQAQNLPVYNLQPVEPAVTQTSQETPAAPEPVATTQPQFQYAQTTPSKLFGIIAASDHCYDGFISPMSNPVYFEDPRTLTEARVIFANHTIPSGLGGGQTQLIAMQARAALTENLSIIATKDGYFFSQNSLMNDGFADVNAGLKYNLYKDQNSQTLLSTGFTFGIPLGTHAALQGRGNGEFNLFLSGGQQIGSYMHVLSTFGGRIPANTSDYTTSTYWSNHLDTKLGQSPFYVFTEANWYHWCSNGTQFPAPVEGLDLFNLGSTGVNGNDIVTGAYGVKFKPNGNLEVGIAYEIPYTERKDIIQNRLTADLILRY